MFFRDTILLQLKHTAFIQTVGLDVLLVHLCYFVFLSKYLILCAQKFLLDLSNFLITSGRSMDF